MRVFEMIMRVQTENLTTVLEVLKDNADLVSMKQIEVDDVEVAKKKPRKHRPRPNGALTGGQLVKEAVSGGKTVTSKELVKLFHANGFAKTSAAPAVNQLVRDGEIKKLSEGVYTSI